MAERRQTSMLHNRVVKNLCSHMHRWKSHSKGQKGKTQAKLPYIHMHTKSTLFLSFLLERNFDMQARSHLCINKSCTQNSQKAPTTLPLCA